MWPGLPLLLHPGAWQALALYRVPCLHTQCLWVLLGGALLQAGRGAKEVAQEGTGNISILWFF